MHEHNWTLSKRKGLLTFLDAVEAAVDSGSISTWTEEFDQLSVHIIQTLIETAAALTGEESGIEEFGITSEEFIHKLIFVTLHGISNTKENTLFDEFERDQNFLR